MYAIRSYYGECPEVEIAGDEIRIGEAGNLAVLKRAEWNVLVDLAKAATPHLRVVEDFLRFARPAPVERGRFDVNAELREVLLLTRQQAIKNGVRTELEAGEVPPVAGDRGQLRQAFLNLVLNALQAMPAGGTLRLESEALGGQLRIRFADSGQGIPAENLERIFNPFFTTRQEGTGLGLAITHRIVQGHGGRIEVQSRLGEGTTFTVVLPVENP